MIEQFDNHIVVIGWNDFSRKVIDQLVIVDNQVAVVTENPDATSEIEEYFGTDLVEAHFTHFNSFNGFEPVNIERCRKVFINLETDHRELQAVLELQAEYGHDLEIDVVIENEDLEETFRVAGTSYTVSPDSISSKVVASHVFEEDVGTLSTELLRATEANSDCEFQQYRLLEGHSHVGQTYGDLFWRLKREYNTILLGVSRPQPDGSRQLHRLPDHDLELQAGDYAIVITHGEHEEQIVNWFGIDEGITHAEKFDSV